MCLLSLALLCRSLEQAASVCKVCGLVGGRVKTGCDSVCCVQEMKHLEQSAEFLERASACYHESGHPDTAGQVLTKAAK